MAQVGYVESQASTYIWGRLIVDESRSGTTSTITATLQVRRTNSYGGATYQYGSGCKYTIYIDGTGYDIWQTASSYVTIPAYNTNWITVGTATKSISHTAAKTISCSWNSTNMGSYLSCSGSCNCSLAAFVTKINANMYNVTTTSSDVSAYITWSAQSGTTVNIACEIVDNSGNYIRTLREWTRQSSGNWYSLYSSDIASLESSGYSRVRWTLKTLVNGTAMFYDTHDYDFYKTSEISVSPTNFNVGDSVYIYITRQRTSLTHRVSVSLGSWSKTITSSASSSATWNTSSDRTSIYEQSPSGDAVSGYITVTTYYGSTYVGSRSVAIKANLVNDPTLAPTFTNDFIIRDVDSATLAITGDNTVFVEGKSSLQVTIPAEHKMQPKYGANGASYSFQYENTIVSKTYSANSAVTANLGAPLEGGTNRITVRAFDSRQYYTDAVKTFTVINYDAPELKGSATRLNGFENQTTLRLNATFSQILVNNVAKNTILDVQYRFKEATAGWGNSPWEDIDFEIEGGRIVSPSVLFNLDNKKAWDFQYRITDRFGVTIVDDQVPQGIPIVGLYEDGRVSINTVPENSDKGLHVAKGDHIFKQMYPAGSIYESTSSDNPSTYFGGNWTQLGTRTVNYTTIYTFRRTS